MVKLKISQELNQSFVGLISNVDLAYKNYVIWIAIRIKDLYLGAFKLTNRQMLRLIRAQVYATKDHKIEAKFSTPERKSNRNIFTWGTKVFRSCEKISIVETWLSQKKHFIKSIWGSLVGCWNAINIFLVIILSRFLQNFPQVTISSRPVTWHNMSFTNIKCFHKCDYTIFVTTSRDGQVTSNYSTKSLYKKPISDYIKCLRKV